MNALGRHILGRHILVEFNGFCPSILDDVTVIEESMVEAARRSGATVIQSTFHHFSPFGVFRSLDAEGKRSAASALRGDSGFQLALVPDQSLANFSLPYIGPGR